MTARGIARGRTWALPTVLAIGSFLFEEILIVGGALGTREQTVPAFAAPALYLPLWAAAWRRERAA